MQRRQPQGDRFFQNRGKVNVGKKEESNEKELSFKERLDSKKNGFQKAPTEEELEEHFAQKRHERYQNQKQNNNDNYNKKKRSREEEEEEEVDEENNEEQEKEEDEDQDVVGSTGKRPKSAPVEMSSKVPVGRGRIVFPVKVKASSRDPRFDDLSGEFDERRFEKQYKFLDDLKERDINDLGEQIKKEKDPYNAEKLKRAQKVMMDRRQSELARRERRDKVTEIRQEIRSDYKSSHGGNSGSSRRSSYFPKKSELRSMELREKFDKLNENNQLDAYLKKRSARKSKQQHVGVPMARNFKRHSDSNDNSYPNKRRRIDQQQ